MTNFSDLLTNNKRDDDYVNATALCKTFGKRYLDFNQTKPAKDLKTLLSRGITEKPLTYSKNNIV